MSDLLDEVSTDIQAERSDLIIAKLVKVFFIICLLVLASVAFYAWKEHASEKLQTELSVIYNKAMTSIEQNNTVEANKLLDEIIASSHQQFAALAYLQKASLLMKENKFEEAQEVLLQSNNHKHFDLALRELAQVTYISNKLLDNKFDKPEIDTEIFDRITKENKPWRVLALQLKAMYMIKNNDIRPLSKLASVKELEGDSEHRTASVHKVHADSSTDSTHKLPTEVEFSKRSIDGAKNILNLLLNDQSLTKNQNLITAIILDSLNAK